MSCSSAGIEVENPFNMKYFDSQGDDNGGKAFEYPGTNTNDRFEAYMQSIGTPLKVMRCLFVAIPLPDAVDIPRDLQDAQIAAVEHALKIICQPVFGMR